MSADVNAELPDGNTFAFTILDDTDDARVDNVAPLYELLRNLGIRTTKTVWPVACPEGSLNFFAGSTLEDPEYRRFCIDLQDSGFEITWHSATMESSSRTRIEEGLNAFDSIFATKPRVHTNHAENRENIYWGEKRYCTPVFRWLARLKEGRRPFEGEVIGSPYFWGDLCKARFPYIRNFTFYELDTRTADPFFPYRLAQTPFANLWFSTADAADVDEFRRLVTIEAVEKLSATGGVCILSTHLGKGFVVDGKVDPQVERVLRHIATLPGWFVPVGTLLDHLVSVRRPPRLTRSQLFRLEARHIRDRIRGLR